jgi:hypothetical protein
VKQDLDILKLMWNDVVQWDFEYFYNIMLVFLTQKYKIYIKLKYILLANQVW